MAYRLHIKPEVRILNEVISYRGTTFAAAHGFSSMDNFNKKLLHFIEVGLMSKWYLYHSQLLAISSHVSKEEDLLKVFLVRIIVFLIAGYFLTLVVLIDEILWHYFTYKKGLRLINLQKKKESAFKNFLVCSSERNCTHFCCHLK